MLGCVMESRALKRFNKQKRHVIAKFNISAGIDASQAPVVVHVSTTSTPREVILMSSLVLTGTLSGVAFCQNDQSMCRHTAAMRKIESNFCPDWR